jgi:hypothetical protein
LPLQQLCRSLLNYHASFGEFPEFARFIGHKDLGEQELLQMLRGQEAKFLEMSKHLGRSKTGETLEGLLFDKEFFAVCERIKLKGEL